MDLNIFGYIAGALTTICFIPQAIKIIVYKSAKGVSLLMYIIFSAGVATWLIYGITINNHPIIIFNAITLVLSLLIVFNLIRYREK